MTTAQHRAFVAINRVLTDHKIAWAVIHQADGLPHGWSNDLDLWVEHLDDDAIAGLLIELRGERLDPTLVFSSAVGTTAINCLSRPEGENVHLDFATQVQASTRVPILSNAQLAAAVVMSRDVPTLDDATTLEYLLAKRLEKGLRRPHDLLALREAAARVDPEDRIAVVERLLGHDGVQLLQLLETGRQREVHQWLQHHQRQFYGRAAQRAGVRFAAVLCADVARIAGRLTRPAGMVVDISLTPGAETMLRRELAHTFRGLAEDSRTPRWDQAHNRLVVRYDAGRESCRSDVKIVDATADPVRRVLDVQYRRLLNRHRSNRTSTFPVLTYHAVGLASAHRHGAKLRYEISADRLTRDLDDLAASGFRASCLASANSDTSRAVALTFDDGNHTDVDVVLPLLLQRNMTATFFVPSARVGQTGYLSEAAIRELADAGMEIGSHGVSHIPFTELNAEQRRDELRSSKEALEAWVDHEVQSFAFPGGLCTSGMVAEVVVAGYHTASTTKWRHAEPGFGNYVVPRCTIGNGIYAVRAIDVASATMPYLIRSAAFSARDVLHR